MRTKVVLCVLTTIASGALARGMHGHGRGNFLDGLIALVALAGAWIWLHKSWAGWSARKASGEAPQGFQDTTDVLLCVIGWALMAGLLSVGPLFLIRVAVGKEVAFELWPYSVAALFGLIVWLKRS